MQTFTTLLATLATLNTISASPINLFTRATCGSAPAGSGSQNPLSQPSGIQTAQACQTSCNSNTQCQSFVFGMVDNTIKCMLFSVAASQVPSQGSANLVAFDKACTSVPAVKPTTANPTGANTGSNSNTNPNQGTAGNTGNNQQGQQQSGNKPAGQKRATCGATPAGSNKNTAPLSRPANIKSSADCQKQCKANTSCKSFTFGDNVCKLFSVAAAAVPAATGGQVFDVGCSV